ncbi:MAG: UDP-N-acetylmuramoyl-L-alanine--D-glutamate ligase [Bdellovibrionaceae bacterium]|nr:UDP-N-acetylmuramoyl-L-alanine--D-glutamate ligase [Bdellovibrio sp.]
MLNTTSWVKNLKTPIAVIGLGKSGLAAVSFLKLAGYQDADIITYDDKKASPLGYKHVTQPTDLTNLFPRTLVVSPGVSLNTNWIQQIAATGARVTSELTLATSVLTTEKLIGVTGSVGKSTVTSLIGASALTDDPNAFVGGNLGTPFCQYAIDILNGRTQAHWIILELSSYQLENCAHLEFEFSAITFLSANHLERYASLEEYYRTKLQITHATKQICFINKTSEDAVQFAKLAKCAYQEVSAETFEDKELLKSVLLIGAHNKDNFAIAAELAKAAGFSAESLTAMAQFKGLLHRLEFVNTIKGVKYINDSKATSMDSVEVAAQGCLESLTNSAKLYLLLGGKDKTLPWEQLAHLAVPQIIPLFFGACGQLAKNKSQLSGPYFSKLIEALEHAYQSAQAGDVVLLSPGGTSLDEFKNFEDRGEFFKKFVTQKSAQRSLD